MAGKYDRNRKYMMHCKRCGYQFAWDKTPLYIEIREAQIEYESLRRILGQFPEHERTKDNERYMRLRHRAQTVAADIKDLKNIAEINERISDKGRLEEMQNVIREQYGEQELSRLLAMVDERLRPYTVTGLMKNWREQ